MPKSKKGKTNPIFISPFDRVVPWRRLGREVDETSKLLNHEGTGRILERRSEGEIRIIQRGRILKITYNVKKRELRVRCIKRGTWRGNTWNILRPDFTVKIPRNSAPPLLWSDGHIRFMAEGSYFTIYPAYTPVISP